MTKAGSNAAIKSRNLIKKILITMHLSIKVNHKNILLIYSATNQPA